MSRPTSGHLAAPRGRRSRGGRLHGAPPHGGRPHGGRPDGGWVPGGWVRGGWVRGGWVRGGWVRGGGRRGAWSHRCLWRGGWREPVGPDVVVEPRGLGQRSHGQFAVQDLDQCPVLAEGGGPLPRPCLQPDESLMGRLVQLVEAEPSPGVVNRAGQVSVRHARHDQPLERPGEFLAEPVRGGRLPVVEFRAAPQRETGQEVIPVEPDGAIERLGTRLGGQRLELGDVHPHPARLQRHRGPGDLEPVADRRRRDRECAAQ